MTYFPTMWAHLLLSFSLVTIINNLLVKVNARPVRSFTLHTGDFGFVFQAF
jgi:hypothetical protein